MAIRNAAPRLAILVLTDHSDEDFGLRVVECGAQDVVAKDLINGQLLYRAMRYGIARQRQISHFKAAAHTDCLTGLGNRRALDLALTDALQQYVQDRRDFGFLILDVDHFKQFNDKHGHRAGDVVLSELGGLLLDSLPEVGICSRYGGEEFGVLMANTCSRQGYDRMQALLERIATHWIEIEGGRYRVTASAGLTISQPNDTVGDIIQRADIALYLAKSNGRNCGEINVKPAVANVLAGETFVGGKV